MPAEQLVLVLAFGLMVGFVLGLVGGGATFFGVPLLHYGLGLPPHQAVCVSMVAVGVLSLGGAARCWRTGRLNLAIAAPATLGGWLGVPAGVLLGRVLSATQLLALFAGIAGTTALLLFLRAGRGEDAMMADAAGAIPSACGRPEPTPGRHRHLRTCSFALGIPSGFLAGLFGVGGGFLFVPLLCFLLEVEIHLAIMTSWFVIGCNSLAATAGHLLAGQTIPPLTAAAFAGGGLVGMSGGSRLAGRLRAKILRRIFAAGLLGISVWMLWRELLK